MDQSIGQFENQSETSEIPDTDRTQVLGSWEGQTDEGQVGKPIVLCWSRTSTLGYPGTSEVVNSEYQPGHCAAGDCR